MAFEVFTNPKTRGTRMEKPPHLHITAQRIFISASGLNAMGVRESVPVVLFYDRSRRCIGISLKVRPDHRDYALMLSIGKSGGAISAIVFRRVYDIPEDPKGVYHPLVRDEATRLWVASLNETLEDDK